MLTIQLIGSPQILLNGEEIKLKRRKSRALLYYLAANPQPLTREHLLAFFWPDTERSSAQQILRTSLHGLRKGLGEALVIDEERLSLAPGVEIDQRQYVNLLSKGTPDRETLEQAMSLYRGDFLADFSLPDTPSFENWLAIERERLRRMAVRALAKMSRDFVAEGDYQSALECIERALTFDPLQEDLQRENIRLLYLSGDRPGAIKRYDQLRRLLDEELGVPPMLETRHLYDAILNDTLTSEEQQARISSQQPTINPRQSPVREKKPSARLGASFPETTSLPANLHTLPFVGRKTELAMLHQLAAELPPKAAARLVLIEGEPGIGKSRLALEFIRQTNLLPVIGSAHELEQAIPYHPIIEALRSLLNLPEWFEIEKNLNLQEVWRKETYRLLPELNPSAAAPGSASPANESRLWEGIHQFLVAIARLYPLVLFIDDLHWADASTFALLGYLVRQTDGPILYLGTARPALPRSALAGLSVALMRSFTLTPIYLPRLNEKEISILARQINPDFAFPLAEWLLRNSEGVPYILAELVRYGQEIGTISPEGGVNLSALSSTPVVPQTVYSLTLSRLNQLSDSARRVVDTAVSIGREFAFEVIYRAAGLSETAALDALDELRLAGLIEPVEENLGTEDDLLYFTFNHSIILEVAYQEMGEARHRLLHRRVAEAMEKVQSYRPEKLAGQIAFHYAEGGDFKRAAPFAYQAGLKAAGVAAWAEAIEFFDKALKGESDRFKRIRILISMARARLNSGQAARASEDYRVAAALAEPDSPEQAEILLDLAESLLTQARFAEVISLVQQVHQSQRQDLAMRALFLWGTALSLEGSDLESSAELLHKAEELCKACSGALPLANIKFELGSVLAQQGDLESAVTLYRESKAEAEKAGEEGLPRLILAYNNLAYHLHLLGDDTAIEYAETGLEMAQEKGFLTPQPYLYSTMGEIALTRPDLQKAEEYFREGLALAERYDIPERVAGITANLGLVAIQRSQFDLAIHYLSTALALADTLGTLHLAAQIKIWLVPLLPVSEAHVYLTEARAIAESSKRLRLLDEVARLEAKFSKPNVN